jgi:hypothetical protein
MVDEVEDILREIAESVRAEQALSLTSRPNGQPADIGMGATQTVDGSLKSSLARIDSYLTTTGRAWDRLPPVFSYRTGAVARLELWIKNFFKRTTRWYAWEQVNFNAAVHHALRETLSALSAFEIELESARRQLATEYELLSKKTEQIESDLHLKRAEIDAQRKALEHEIEVRGREFQAKQAQLDAQASQIAAQRAQVEALSENVNARLSDLTTELRERSESLLQEQRVSFKQLSLEMTELTTLVNRRGREIETLLAKSQKQP